MNLVSTLEIYYNSESFLVVWSVTIADVKYCIFVELG